MYSVHKYYNAKKNTINRLLIYKYNTSCLGLENQYILLICEYIHFESKSSGQNIQGSGFEFYIYGPESGPKVLPNSKISSHTPLATLFIKEKCQLHGGY